MTHAEITFPLSLFQLPTALEYPSSHSCLLSVCYVSGIFTELTVLNSVIYPEVGFITIPIKQMIEFRLRGLKHLTQGHSFPMRRSQKFILILFCLQIQCFFCWAYIRTVKDHIQTFCLLYTAPHVVVYTINTCMELGPNSVKMVRMIYLFMCMYLAALFGFFTCTCIVHIPDTGQRFAAYAQRARVMARSRL